MFPTPFLEAALKRVAVDVKDDDCLFAEADDSYSEWGLLTPPWSPCDSDDAAAMDSRTAGECPAAAAAAVELATRARCDSFLCECSSVEQADGPVLRDCMWSQTTGLLPPRSLVGAPTADASPDAPADADANPDSAADCRPCCPAVATVCANHTARCVDPRNVFPCGSGVAAAPRSSRLHTVLVTPDCSVTKSPPAYDPDSETSAYCSSFSGSFSAAACKLNASTVRDTCRSLNRASCC